MNNFACVFLAFFLLSSPEVLAGGDKGGKDWSSDKHGGGKHSGDGKRQSERKVHSVPEIDSAGAGIALALVAGVIAVRRERRIAKQNP